MSQRSLFWPLSLLATFALLVVMLLLGSLSPSLSAQANPCITSYPTPGPVRDNCFLTATARTVNNNNTSTAQAKTAYPPPSATTQRAAPPEPTATATITPTATLTPTNTTVPATATLGPTLTSTATRIVIQGVPTPTATSFLADRETIVCAPGTTVIINGTDEPERAILAYFNARPVGGAMTRSDGSYSIQLRIGDERPGSYPIELRERLTWTLVRELACEVPATTPTPTWPL